MLFMIVSARIDTLCLAQSLIKNKVNGLSNIFEKIELEKKL